MQGKAEASPWHAATQLAPFGLLGPALLGFCIFLTSLQFTHVAGLGLLISASAPHLLEARGEQTYRSEGPHATMLLAEPIAAWLQWG